MPVWIDEALAQQADDEISRVKLAQKATQLARQALPEADIDIFWDDMWIRRLGSLCFPDPDMFRSPNPNWQRWAGLAEKYLHDAQDYWFYVYKPNLGDVIVDVGAGRGEDVFAFSRSVGPTGRVWAIEPHPVSFSVLKKFCELNTLTNVTALNYACTDRPGVLQIETLPVWESNYVRSGEPSDTSNSVPTQLLDVIASQNDIRDVDFLKMNIEGAERFALPGCRDVLSRTRNVCIAAHDFRAARGEGEAFRTLDFVRNFLADAGFDLITRADDARYYVPYHVHGIRR